MTEFITAREEDFPEILQIIGEIYRELPNKEWFSLDEEEVLVRYMKEEGFALKALCDGALAGVFIVRTHHLGEENLGYDLGFSDQQRERAAHMEIAMVKKQWRGQGLQQRMMRECEDILKEQGYCYLLGTAHPENQASVKSFLKLGYQHKKTKEKYGGLLRGVFCKELIES